MPKTKDKLNIYFTEMGARMKKYRLARRMTLEDMGLMIGLDPSSVFNLEKGRNVTVQTLIKVAIALNKKPADILKIGFNFDENDLEFLNKKTGRK